MAVNLRVIGAIRSWRDSAREKNCDQNHEASQTSVPTSCADCPETLPAADSALRCPSQAERGGSGGGDGDMRPSGCGLGSLTTLLGGSIVLISYQFFAENPLLYQMGIESKLIFIKARSI